MDPESPNPEYLSITPENIEAWSLLADKISSQSPTAKKTVTGNRVIWQVGDATFERPRGEPILEFLTDLLKDTFGKQWGTEQNALPEENRHVVMRWWHSLCELQKESAGPNHRQGQKYQITPSGDAMEFFTLADDLYRLRLVGALRPKLVDRLKHYAEFQGARYECAIASSFIRTGFDLAWEVGPEKKCEFVATQKQSGESIAIEVKSRRRPGTLNESGQMPDRASLRVDVKHLYEKALGQCPSDIPCGIFINVNLPPESATDNFLIPWNENLEELLAECSESQPTAPVAETCLVFTNFAWHYSGRMRAQGQRYVFTFPQFVKQRLVNQDTFIAIIRAIRTYGELPINE